MTSPPLQIPMVDYLVLEAGKPPHLKANRCVECSALFFDRRNACARCGSRTFESKDLERTGFLRSFTIVHRAAPKVPAPYVSAVVDLDGGGVIKANLVGVEPDPAYVKLGGRVRLTTFVVGTDDDGTDAVAFGFEQEQ
ncbi:Zn-ribbon domain-containing OB-fold protein [Rhodococcus globerulus]|uniref:OB-fold domain-containing protein n=1 Tax=Rhodococcus globerulus TaxID=33008 RepID=A0ABU4C3S4_RHOGO|nr:OB-fold domain-containing protein [Rhodococcus globerulus]MDV6271153.1 OB-fold domain-containing protein [Rhodococcus globerulus]